MSDQPNVLWIIADQLRADHVGFGGGAVRTPNLDALAASGMVFDRAFVANPLCMPNRCSMLTGRVPSAHGVIFNDRSLSWGANTFVRELAGAGYRTALIGKSHIQHGMSHNVVRDYGEAPTSRDALPRGWDSLEDPERYLTDNIPRFEDFYGFQHAEFAIGHGNTVTGHHYRWALEKGADPALLVMVPGPDDPALARYSGWWQVFQPALPEEFYSTTFVTERTIDWLSGHAQEGPWCLECSFPDPHHPFTPPGKWWERYDPEDMPEPATFDDPLTDAPRHLKKIQKWEPRGDYVNMFGPSREMVRHAMAAEFGMIEMLDEGIGRVLEKLDQLGQRENTIVVFTSDHGDMFGDHGLMLKGTMHYQGCLRVPLVIRAPGRNPGRTDSLASSLDIPSTVLGLTGIAPFADMQGVSLAPLLADPTARVRDLALVEEDMPLARLGGPLPLKTRTVLDERYRYTRYSTGEVELYDLDNDPGEMTNLAVSRRAGAVAAVMAEKLADALMRHSAMARMGEL